MEEMSITPDGRRIVLSYVDQLGVLCEREFEVKEIGKMRLEIRRLDRE
jgi:hypothetical protein